MKKMSLKKLVVLAVLAAGCGLALFEWVSNYGRVHTDDAAIEARVIPVAAKVPGYVVELAAADNQPVKKGEILLKIDPRDYTAALEEAQAKLAAAQARLTAGRHNLASMSVSAPSNLESAKAQVVSAEAELKNARQALNRLQKLSDDARSRQSLDDSVAAEKRARANLEDANARLKSAETAPDAVAASEASVEELEAAVNEAQAAVQMAQNDLDDTVVRAAEDGRITRKSVEAGAYVQTGQQLATLVSREIWVVANFKETQLDGMRPGQPVDIDIDAYPGKTLIGKVDSLQAGTGARFSLFPPENATGNFVKIVQRVPVKILFDGAPPEDLHLGPGMSVVPTVHVK